MTETSIRHQEGVDLQISARILRAICNDDLGIVDERATADQREAMIALANGQQTDF
jgi:hypothetical protein